MKKLLAFILSAVMLISLSACGKSKSNHNENEQDTQPQTESTTADTTEADTEAPVRKEKVKLLTQAITLEDYIDCHVENFDLNINLIEYSDKTYSDYPEGKFKSATFSLSPVKDLSFTFDITYQASEPHYICGLMVMGTDMSKKNSELLLYGIQTHIGLFTDQIENAYFPSELFEMKSKWTTDNYGPKLVFKQNGISYNFSLMYNNYSANNELYYISGSVKIDPDYTIEVEVANDLETTNDKANVSTSTNDETKLESGGNETAATNPSGNSGNTSTQPSESSTPPQPANPCAQGHSRKEATCTEPEICTVCGATNGSAAGHKYSAATCTKPQTCTVCGATNGGALGHSWRKATCTEPETCRVCGTTNGSANGHDLNITRCRQCGDISYSLIAKSYNNVRAYNITTRTDHTISQVVISSDGIMSFTFNGKNYSLKLIQTDWVTDRGWPVFDCYINGQLITDAEVHISYLTYELEFEYIEGENF